MTLDEAIRHHEEVAKESRKEQNYWLEPRDKENMFSNVDFEDLAQNACDIAEENEQLAEWLRELKAYREAREEIIRKRDSSQWSELVVHGFSHAIYTIDNHLKEVNADEASDNDK